MAGMLQIITYLLGVYLIVKGIEVLQIGLASNRPDRGLLLIIGFVTLGLCVLAAAFFVSMQDNQAMSLQNTTPQMPQF